MCSSSHTSCFSTGDSVRSDGAGERWCNISHPYEGVCELLCLKCSLPISSVGSEVSTSIQQGPAAPNQRASKGCRDACGTPQWSLRSAAATAVCRQSRRVKYIVAKRLCHAQSVLRAGANLDDACAGEAELRGVALPLASATGGRLS